MNIEQSVKKEEEKLSEITYELDGVHRVRVIVLLTTLQVSNTEFSCYILYLFVHLHSGVSLRVLFLRTEFVLPLEQTKRFCISFVVFQSYILKKFSKFFCMKSGNLFVQISHIVFIRTCTSIIYLYIYITYDRIYKSRYQMTVEC